MQVRTVTYTEVLRGLYTIGFTSMDTHTAEMLDEGWRVQAQSAQPAGKSFFPGVTKPGSMTVTYVK